MININGVNFKETVDSHGRVILYSEPQMVNEFGITVNGNNGAYKDCPFVTLDKEDASAVVDICNSFLPESGDDVEAFGDKAISYERLIDRVDGLYYPAAIISTTGDCSLDVRKAEFSDKYTEEANVSNMQMKGEYLFKDTSATSEKKRYVSVVDLHE